MRHPTAHPCKQHADSPSALSMRMHTRAPAPHLRALSLYALLALASSSHAGEPQVDVTEDGGKRFIKSTGVFSGLELHMFMEPPHYDPRLPTREDRPEMDFSKKRFQITTDSQWQEVSKLS